MPAKSEAQRRFLFATKGPAWAKRHGFDNAGQLPKRAKKRNPVQRRAASRAMLQD